MKSSFVKRLIAFVTAAALLSLFAISSFAYTSSDFDALSSNVALLVSYDYGDILFEKNADLKTSPSSLVKIATAIVAIDYYGENGLDTVITANRSAIDSVPYGTIASGLKGGENLTVRQLLYYILVQSANDATHILAYQIGSENMAGGTDEIGSFVKMLNDFAVELGCNDTYFADSTGVDDSKNVSTARDISKIAAYAYKNETFREISSTVAYSMPETNMNTSRLLTTNNSLIVSSSEYYYELAIGMKSGASDKGRCLVATTELSGRSYIAVVMESDFEEIENEDEEGEITKNYVNHSFIDAKALLTWANDKLIYKTVVDENTVTGIELSVENGIGVDYVMLRPDGKISKLVPKTFDTKDVKIEVINSELPEKLYATVNEGDEVCTAKVIYDGEILGEVKLVCANTVKKNVLLAIGSAISKVLGIPVIRVLIIIVIAVLIIFIIRSSVSKKKKRRIRVVKDNDGNQK